MSIFNDTDQLDRLNRSEPARASLKLGEKLAQMGPIAGGELTTAGGGAAEVVSISGVKTGDIVLWSILNDGTNNVTGVSAVAADGQVTFTFSGDPSNDTIVNYGVFRPVV